MESEKKHICCNIDDNYAPACGVMLCSLFEHNRNEKFEIHILHSLLSEENKEYLNEITSGYDAVCNFHKVDDSLLDGVRSSREDRPLTKAAYYRILISSILDNSISKVLYLDSDLVVLGDLSPLFSIDLSGYALAATRDIGRMRDEKRMQISLPYHKHYFASGLMLVNLDYWRAHNSENDLIAISRKESIFLDQFDQDSLNAVFNGKWFELSVRWLRNYPYVYERSFFENNFDRKQFEESPVIVHYLDYFKPWNRIDWVGTRWNKYRSIYYNYLKHTPWKETKSKPVKLRLGEYKKFGLYRYLIIYSFNSLLNDIGYMVGFKALPGLRKLFFFPFYFYLKFYYKIRRSDNNGN